AVNHGFIFEITDTAARQHDLTMVADPRRGATLAHHVPARLVLAVVMAAADREVVFGPNDLRAGLEAAGSRVVINAVGRVGDHKVRRDATEHALNVGRHCAVAAEQSIACAPARSRCQRALLLPAATRSSQTVSAFFLCCSSGKSTSASP